MIRNTKDIDKKESFMSLKKIFFNSTTFGFYKISEYNIRFLRQKFGNRMFHSYFDIAFTSLLSMFHNQIMYQMRTSNFQVMK